MIVDRKDFLVIEQKIPETDVTSSRFEKNQAAVGNPSFARYVRVQHVFSGVIHE
jgi:hypothetical protein